MSSKFHDSTRLFVIVGPDDGYGPARYIIYTTYGANGGCRAISYMTGDVLGRATGGGYDITATALVDMIARRWPAVPTINGATGLATVREHMARHGVAICDTQAIMWGTVPGSEVTA